MKGFLGEDPRDRVEPVHEEAELAESLGLPAVLELRREMRVGREGAEGERWWEETAEKEMVSMLRGREGRKWRGRIG